MKLSNRIFVGIFWIIVVSGLASSLTGAVIISRAVRSEALSRVSSDLKVARLYLEERLDDLDVSSLATAEGFDGKLTNLMSPAVSLLLEESAPNLAAYLRDSEGLDLSLPQRGFVTLPAGLVTDPRMNTLSPPALCEDGTTLWLFATRPGVRGTAFSGILLNGNEEVVAELQELLFGKGMYDGKPFGTVTVFCRDRRVATTVVGPAGTIALGTMVSEEVRDKVLLKGELWLNRAFVVDDWYLSAYEPLKNVRGRNIGILYVGVLERKYLDIRNRALALLSGITIPMLLLFVLGVFLMTKTIVRPVSSLAGAIRAIASGEEDPHIAVPAKSDELKSLTDSFRKMALAVRRREEMLKRTNSELEEANRDYQELLSFVTHELNNSVGSLLLNVSLLNDESTGGLNEEQRDIAAQVLRDVERFRDMVRNYLNISRLEKGTLRFNPIQLDVGTQVVEPVLKRLMSRIEHSKMELRWRWECDSMVRADPELLDICYSNLLVNALKYGEGYIELTCADEDGHVVLGVVNGGKPIPGDQIDRLFRKFSRLVKSDDGAGLGLYLIRRIIDRHGGSVWCESSAERGTGFFIRLA